MDADPGKKSNLELELTHGEKRFKHTNLRSFFFFSQHKQSEKNMASKCDEVALRKIVLSDLEFFSLEKFGSGFFKAI
jgi:hypothetical protein